MKLMKNGGLVFWDTQVCVFLMQTKDISHDLIDATVSTHQSEKDFKEIS